MSGALDRAGAEDDWLRQGSDRVFGLVLSAALLVTSMLNGWHAGRLWPWTAAAAVPLLLIAGLRPRVLHPLHRGWLALGLAMHAVVNPLVMALLFYGTVLPTGLVLRLQGRDLLRLRRDPQAASYWIARDGTPPPESMKDQF